MFHLFICFLPLLYVSVSGSVSVYTLTAESYILSICVPLAVLTVHTNTTFASYDNRSERKIQSLNAFYGYSLSCKHTFWKFHHIEKKRVEF